MRLPVRVPDGKEGVLVLNTEQEVLDYERRVYAEGHKVRNSMGAPEPNFSVQPTPEDYAKLQQTSLFGRK